MIQKIKSNQVTDVDFTQLRFLLLSCVKHSGTFLQFEAKTASKVYPKLVTGSDGGEENMECPSTYRNFTEC